MFKITSGNHRYFISTVKLPFLPGYETVLMPTECKCKPPCRYEISGHCWVALASRHYDYESSARVGHNDFVRDYL